MRNGRMLLTAFPVQVLRTLQKMEFSWSGAIILVLTMRWFLPTFARVSHNYQASLGVWYNSTTKPIKSRMPNMIGDIEPNMLQKYLPGRNNGVRHTNPCHMCHTNANCLHVIAREARPGSTQNADNIIKRINLRYWNAGRSYVLKKNQVSL